MSSKCTQKSTGKGDTKKTVRRRSEMAVTIPEKSVNSTKYPAMSNVRDSTSQINPNKRITEKYRKPEFNTTLKLAKELEILKSVKPRKITSTTELTPRTKAIIIQQTTKKLNFEPSKPVYKGLIAINENDPIFNSNGQKPVRKKYVSKTTKDLLPDLAEFLTPIEPLNYSLPLYEYPDILRKPIINNFKNIHDLYVKFCPDY